MESVSGMNGTNGKQISHNAIVLFLGALAVIVLAPLISGCGYDQASTGKGAAVVDDPGSPSLTQDHLQEIVAYGFGETVSVQGARLWGNSMEKNIEIEVDRPATCGDASVEATMSTFARNIMSSLFEYPEVSSVTITMYGIDQGVKGDDVASRVVVNRAAAMDMDWSMFGPMTMPSMVTGYYIHPQILENSNSLSSGFTSPHS